MKLERKSNMNESNQSKYRVTESKRAQQGLTPSNKLRDREQILKTTRREQKRAK